MSDDETKVEPTGPVGPAGLRWTYLRPYGAGDEYSVDLYRAEGLDSLHFLKVGELLPREAEEGTLSLTFSKEELDKLISELTWVRMNWGAVGRDAH